VPHLPAGGEIVLFDRSWYNRAGVERVMGFAQPEQVEAFFHDVPEFERMLVRSGIKLVKYWFPITDQEQQLRFLMLIYDPTKQWKLRPMDLQSRVRWEQYTKAKEEMLERTNIQEAPWWIVPGNAKKRARLRHLLDQVPTRRSPQRLLQDGGPGAWELGACADYIDLNNEGVKGGEQISYIAGLNWYPNNFIRFLLDGAVTQVFDARNTRPRSEAPAT
jgi:hypothetical protein